MTTRGAAQRAGRRGGVQRRVWAVFAVGLGGIALGLPAISLVRTPWMAVRPSAAATFTVSAADFTIRVPATGQIEASSSLSISVPRVQTGGLTIFSLVRDGTIVEEGDTLVEFDASELLQHLEDADFTIEAALREMDASVLRGGDSTATIATDHAIAGMELDKVHTQAPRDPELFSQHEIREGELDVDLSTTRVAEYAGKIAASRQIEAVATRMLLIDRKKQEARRGQLAETIGSLKVLAPRGGMVLLQKDAAGNSVMVGETRWPGFVLMTMPDTTSVKARVQILESDAGMVKPGQPATVIVDSHPDRSFAATVERIDAIARPLDKESPVKYFETVLRIDDVDPDVLAPGKLMRASITTAVQTRAITVPRIAVVDDAGGHAVWVERITGAERRSVRVGGGDATHQVVTEGLVEGDVVRLDPAREARAHDPTAAPAP